MKKIISIVVVVILLFQSIAFGHTIIPNGKWSNTTTISQKKYLLMSVNTTNLNSIWKTAASNGANNWNNYSNSYVCSFKYDYTTANVQCASRVPWFAFFSADSIAITNICDSNGIWAWDFNNGSAGNIGTTLIKGHIYTNSKYDNDSVYSQYDKEKTMTHELGHVMNLGHPSTETSVMRQGSPLPWTDYNKLQDHDRNDLVSYYKTKLGR